MSMVLVDSHDSFTWNLVQAFQRLGERVRVVQSVDVHASDLMAMNPDRVVLGPGPGHPAASRLVPLVRGLAGRVPILGVCLGHQAIGMAFGAKIIRHTPVHGHAVDVIHDGMGLFDGLPGQVAFTRYHSLVVDPTTVPTTIQITATSPGGAIMGLRHSTLQVAGVQFHPESVLSGDAGLRLLHNFTRMARAPAVREHAARA